MGHEDMAGADMAPAVTTQPDGLGRPSPQWAVGHEDSHFSLSPRRPRVRPKLQDQVCGPVLRACCPPDPVPGPRQGGTNVGCPLCFYHGCPPPPLGSTQRQVPPCDTHPRPRQLLRAPEPPPSSQQTLSEVFGTIQPPPRPLPHRGQGDNAGRPRSGPWPAQWGLGSGHRSPCSQLELCLPKEAPLLLTKARPGQMAGQGDLAA